MISARCFYYSNKKLITQQNNCLVVSDIMLNKFKLNMHFFSSILCLYQCVINWTYIIFKLNYNKHKFTFM